MTYLESMATETNPAALRWNLAETQATGDLMSPKRVTSLVTSKCGRVEVIRVGGEFNDFAVEVDGVRAWGRVENVGGREWFRSESVHGVRLAKALAAELVADPALATRLLVPVTAPARPYIFPTNWVD